MSPQARSDLFSLKRVVTTSSFALLCNLEVARVFVTSSISMIVSVDTIEKQGFTIDNPNAQGSCACGDSFN